MSDNPVTTECRYAGYQEFQPELDKKYEDQVKEESKTTSHFKSFIDGALWMGGGWVFWIVGYITGHWWSMFSTAWWLAGKTSAQVEALRCQTKQ